MNGELTNQKLSKNLIIKGKINIKNERQQL